jgi:hypothetical protein
VYEVHADCGCTTVQFPQVLKPGESGELRGTFHPAAVWSGEMEKGLVVKTSDPRQPEMRLTFTAEIIPLIRITPPNPLVVNFKRGEVIRQEIRLVPRKGRAVKITGPKSDSSLVKAVMDPPKDEGGEWTYKLHLVIGPQNQPGDFNGRLMFETTDPSVRVFPITVVGFAQSGPVATPTAIQPPEFTPEAGKEITRFQVFTRKGKLRIRGVETGDPAIEAEVISRTPDQFYEVVLRYRGGWHPGNVSRSIRVLTDDPGAPVLAVPFSLTVAGTPDAKTASAGPAQQ